VGLQFFGEEIKMKPKIIFINAETQEQVIRELNDAEYAQHLIDLVELEAYQAAKAAAQAEEDAAAAEKTEAKKQALAALGLSQEVVNLLAE
jgi:hypothetical protein